ncbi:dihydroorotase [Pantoea sp. Aalb]|uniref:dihydroorotase n=1 Tax=Pantoea sp. Aalb TaxID=2576762 RepID=UPI0013214B3F|nr:dihydroorotase [Pantoea sp. Aalb]MXP67471.1 dihydroorotase [Pantoea sp. Aalb]
MIVKQKQITIRSPDDCHVHLRDGYILKRVLPYTSKVNSRAIVMPNLIPPITSIKTAIAYRKRILAALPTKHNFIPLMTCYLTDSIDPNEIEHGYREGIFIAAKFYPVHSTTNSSFGVTKITRIQKVLERMQKIGMPILVHGEITEPHIDIFDREARFIEIILEPLRKQLPGLKVVMEHITTKEAAQYVASGNKLLGATITPQHLMFNRNHMLVNKLNPHLYCLPILKRNIHQNALHKLIASGHCRVFLGTDTAPHLRFFKEASYGCAGVFNSPSALPAYATIFEEINSLEYFERFCSENGAKFYNLPLNKTTITLVRKPWKVPNGIYNNTLIPFLAGKVLNWRIKSNV